MRISSSEVLNDYFRVGKHPAWSKRETYLQHAGHVFALWNQQIGYNRRFLDNPAPELVVLDKAHR